MRKQNNHTKRHNNVVASLMRNIAFVVCGQRQMFFSLKTGKYVPVNSLTFNKVRTSRHQWYTTAYAVLEIVGERVIKGSPTTQRVLPLTLDEQYKAAVPEADDWFKQQNQNHLKYGVLFCSFPNSVEPTTEVVSKIIKIITEE